MISLKQLNMTVAWASNLSFIGTSIPKKIYAEMCDEQITI